MADMEIRPPSGSRKSKRIAGRGNSARRGVKAGKGDKGQNSRSGGGVRPGFEGGQMPLYRRIPRKGFSNYPFKKLYDVVNVGTLDAKFADGDTVTIEALKEKRVVKKKFASVKILGEGELNKKLTVSVDAVSASAKEKIEKAGGALAGKPAAADDAKDKGSVDGE
jgi:large subunit ribosomal protein L15